MKTKLHWLFIICIAFSVNSLFAQQVENKPQGPIYVGTSDRVDHVPSIASRANTLQAVDLVSGKPQVMQDGRASKYDVVPGKGSKGADILAQNPHRLEGAIPMRAPLLVFETAASNSQPTDPSLAVGPNHVIAVTNTAFRIFDKDGNPLTALLPPNPTIFPNGGCCDLTASYDNAADRWVLSFLGGGAQIAVSNGPDPVNDGWTSYSYGIVNDYQKLSVWRDGYYMTENTGAAQKLHVFDRAAMLNGDATADIQSFALPGLITSGFHSPQVLNISDDNTPTSGGATVVYMQDDAWGGVSNDHIKLWNVDIDWAVPGNSVVSAAVELGAADGVSPYISVFDGGSFVNLAQPSGGTSIDALQATIMNQAQYRKFGSYNSALFNFVVDVDAGGTKQAGIRWYELRQTDDGQPWTVHQEGTYTAPDNRHAWHASLIMDGQGNIGMGYSTMSSPNSADADFRVSSMYTGRFANDPLGTMTVAEETILIGDGNIPGTRYGDYSKIDIDPSDDKKFWFVNEMMQSGRKNIAGVFQLAPNTTNDVGVISVDTPVTGALTNNETVTVTVFNFGENDASGFDVTYQVDGGATVTEAFVGTIASQTTAQHTFATGADLSTEGQTYSIQSCTVYGADEDNSNDCVTQDVTHLLQNDVGVTAITAPVSGTGLGNETVTVTIENFGSQDQTGFDVNYTLDGGTPVVETVGVNVPAGGSVSYSFTTTVDLSATQTYSLQSCTLLAGDQTPANDCTSTNVTNQLNVCVPVATSGCNIDGIKRFILGDIDADDGGDGCNGNGAGYADRRDLVTDLDRSAGNNTHILQAQHNWNTAANNEALSVWVDFDDSGTFEESERLISGVGFQTNNQLEDFDLVIPTDAALGSHILRAKAIDVTAAGDILDPCSNFAFGEVHDYTVNIVDTSLSAGDFAFGEFNIFYEDNNQFLISLPTSSINERLNLNVVNALGQNLMWRTLENESGNGYEYRLDMSNVSSGVYFVKIGNATNSSTKKIIVK